MDQVKVYLAILKKHHFWLLASVAALLGVICWWMGKSSLASQTSTNRKLVEGKYTSITGLKGDLPNGNFATGVNELHDKVKKDVFADWQQQYEQQQKLFKWPNVQEVRDIKPGQSIPSSTRQMYKRLVFPAELERIFTIANVRRNETRAANAQEAPRRPPVDGAAPVLDGATEPEPETEATPEQDGLLVWDSAHRETLRKRYDFVIQPGLDISEVNLRTAQEDMWVLEQMARIIAKTNEGATDEAALAVKRVASIDVAQWAVDESQRNPPTLRLPKPASPGGAAPPPPPAEAAPAPGPGGDAAAAASPDAQLKADTELLEGRYLNDINQPATDDATFAEFKRIFVRMKIDVDERKLNDFLVNCANSELPLDVVRVRIDLPLLSHEKSTGPGDSSRPTSSNNAPQDIIKGPYDVPVEVCGIIQIYNAPDEAKLAQGSGDPTKRSLDMPTGKVKLPRQPINKQGPPR